MDTPHLARPCLPRPRGRRAGPRGLKQCIEPGHAAAQCGNTGCQYVARFCGEFPRLVFPRPLRLPPFPPSGRRSPGTKTTKDKPKQIISQPETTTITNTTHHYHHYHYYYYYHLSTHLLTYLLFSLPLPLPLPVRSLPVPPPALLASLPFGASALRQCCPDSCCLRARPWPIPSLQCAIPCPALGD